MTNSHPNVNGKSLCKCPRNCQNMVHRVARIYCHIIVAFTFDTGPNEEMFTAITFIIAVFVLHFSYARSSGPSLGSVHTMHFQRCVFTLHYRTPIKTTPCNLTDTLCGFAACLKNAPQCDARLLLYVRCRLALHFRFLALVCAY